MTEPRASRRPVAVRRGAENPRPQSSPSRPSRTEQTPPPSSSEFDDERSNRDEDPFGAQNPIKRGVRSPVVAEPRASLSAGPSSFPHRHARASISFLSQQRAAAPMEAQASPGDTQSLGMLSSRRTTVVARARRGGMKPRPSRHVPVLARAGGGVESGRDPSATHGSDSNSSFVSEGETQAEPSPGHSSRMREIARKVVMGV